MKLTFVIPPDNRSGGVRVTVAMGNELSRRGHEVRLAYQRRRNFNVAGARRQIKRLLLLRYPGEARGWLHQFEGMIEPFVTLGDLSFDRHEVVVAVGTAAIPAVYDLAEDVPKIRYNHGLLDDMTAEERAWWRLSMPTITVSSSIVPDLEELTGQPVLAVVPNGLSTEDYFRTNSTTRSGIGTIYSSHSAKDPKTVRHVFARLRAEFPHVPRLAFGTERKPPGLHFSSYTRYPTIAQAREAYNACRVWIVASRTEGFSLPILEAMACGCVVVSTDTYGGKELIRHRENGLLVPVGDCEAIVGWVRKVLVQDRLRSGLVAEGHKTPKRYSWALAASKFEGVCRRLLVDFDSAS